MSHFSYGTLFKSTVILFVCMLLLTGCDPASEETPHFIFTQEGEPLYMVVATKGDVQLQRHNWSGRARLLAGVQLAGNDSLYFTTPDSQATLLCPNLSLAYLEESPLRPSAPVGIESACPQYPKLIAVNGSYLVSPRSGEDRDDYPYILRPRSTKLLASPTLLRWNPAPDATYYTVHIEEFQDGSVVDIWNTTNITATEMLYPGVPPLKEDTKYRLVVEAWKRTEAKPYVSTAVEETFDTSFRLLPLGQSQFIQTQLEAIEQLDLEPAIAALVAASFLREHQLNADALDRLLQFSEVSKDKLIVALMLGDLHYVIGLYDEAWPHYHRGLQEANVSHFPEVQALLLAGMGNAFFNSGNCRHSPPYYEGAFNLFSALGDEVRRDEVGKMLEAAKECS